MSKRHEKGEKMKNKKAFTYIELMVVMALITALLAITAPRFVVYQTRAKQTEARHNLEALYSLQMAYYGEHMEYGSSDCIRNLGWGPEGITRYTYGCGDQTTSTARNPSLIDNCYVGPSCSAVVDFTMCAAANIDNDTTLDNWSIDDAMNLTNVYSDLDN
jgi:prepilin-type N-terminal cleavage/methylation domain-containing protein